MMLWAERRDMWNVDRYNPGPMKRSILGLMLIGVLVTSAWAQKGSPPEKLQSTDIFLTYYKGPPVADPAAYHNSQPGMDFESELQSDDDERFCLQSPQLARTTGVWKGDIEPSYWIHANARPTEAEAYASEHGQKHRQDSVLVFEASADGQDTEYVLSWRAAPALTSPSVVFEAVRRAGFSAATLARNRLLIVDPKAAKMAAAESLKTALGAELITLRGRVRLLDAGDMENALRLYDAFPHSCPTH